MRRDAPSIIRRETDWHDVRDENEAFYLRIAGRSGYRYPGADLGILVTRGRLQTDEHELTDRAKLWIAEVKAQFESVPIGPAEPAVKPEAARPQDALTPPSSGLRCEDGTGQLHVPCARRSRAG